MGISRERDSFRSEVGIDLKLKFRNFFFFLSLISFKM